MIIGSKNSFDYYILEINLRIKANDSDERVAIHDVIDVRYFPLSLGP